jgi:hypothetical protein
MTIFSKMLCALVVLMSFCHEAWTVNASSGQCAILNGTVIKIWMSQDSNGIPLIQGAVGSVTDAPSLWKVQTISGDNPTTQYSKPIFSYNASGDVVAVWQYPDAEGVFFVEAAILPAGTSVWTKQTLIPSDPNQTAGYFDQTASIDAEGNILIVWTSYDKKLKQTSVLGVTGTIISGAVTLNPVTNFAPTH